MSDYAVGRGTSEPHSPRLLATAPHYLKSDLNLTAYFPFSISLRVLLKIFPSSITISSLCNVIKKDFNRADAICNLTIQLRSSSNCISILPDLRSSSPNARLEAPRASFWPRWNLCKCSGVYHDKDSAAK